MSQRMYNGLCLGYGGDREAFKDLVKENEGWLPAARAESCAREFERVKFAFITTILPFVDEERMKKVKATKWNLSGK